MSERESNNTYSIQTKDDLPDLFDAVMEELDQHGELNIELSEADNENSNGGSTYESTGGREIPPISYFEGQSSSSETKSETMPEEPPLTREELDSHLRANEKAVEGIAKSIESQISQISNKQDKLSDDIDSNRRTIWTVGSILAVIIVGLFIYALQRTDTIGDRVFENTQRIEQVAPQSQGQSDPSSGQGSSSQNGNQQ